MILKCNCKHNYQDKRYGPGRRVHNRCTVCGDTKEKQNE